jgi:hypothetical protein
MSWYYKGKVLKPEDIPEWAIGFCYCITHKPSKKKYWGKKVLFFKRRSKINAKEKKLTGTRKTFKVVTKTSGWEDYWGSCLPLLNEIKEEGESKFKREILVFCHNKKHLSYCELELQVKNDCLRVDSYNGTVLGKWYKKDLINGKE